MSLPRVCVALLAALFCLGALARAEEDDEKAEEAKERKWVGTLFAKAAEAPAEVAAVLRTSVRRFNLLADGELAGKLADLAAKKARVTVTGTRTGNAIKVSGVEPVSGGGDTKTGDEGEDEKRKEE